MYEKFEKKSEHKTFHPILRGEKWQMLQYFEARDGMLEPGKPQRTVPVTG